MSFAAKMRQVCKNCTESTIKTYLFQVRGLLKFAGQGGTEPETQPEITRDRDD